MVKLIKQLRNTGLTHASSLQDERIIRLLNDMIISSILLLLVIYVPRLANAKSQLAPLFFAIGEASLLFVLYANHIGKSSISKFFFCWFAPFVLLISQFYIHTPPPLHLGFLILLAFSLVIYQTTKMQITVLIYLLILYGIYIYFAFDVEVAMFERFRAVTWVSKLQFIVAALIILFIVERFATVSETIEKELNGKFEKLTTQNNALQENKLQMEQQNKELTKVNQELEKYAYVASHDLKSPIRTVSSFLSLIKRKLKNYNDQDVHEYIDYATSSAKQMHNLVEDILVFARIAKEKEAYQMVDLNDIINNSIGRLNQQTNKSTQFIFDNLPSIFAHPKQLELLFLELFENAILYNNHEQPLVTIICEETDKEIIISISDNGIGISDEHYGLIFSVFKRLHTQVDYQGSGVGLSNCKKIVDLHQGSIFVESELGKGSIFTIHLPSK